MLSRTPMLASLPASKTCEPCGKTFAPVRPMQKVCSVRCAARQVVDTKKQDRAQTKARRDAVKSRSEWMKEAQQAFNRYCRLRDIRAGYGCVTCGQPFDSRFGGAFDAGHMHSRGSNPHLKFHLHNVALQCVKDNRYLGGLPLQFRAEMVRRHGLARVEAMESIRGPAKFTVDYLRRLKTVFTKKANRLEKRHAMQS